MQTIVVEPRRPFTGQIDEALLLAPLWREDARDNGFNLGPGPLTLIHSLAITPSHQLKASPLVNVSENRKAGSDKTQPSFQSLAPFPPANRLRPWRAMRNNDIRIQWDIVPEILSLVGLIQERPVAVVPRVRGAEDLEDCSWAGWMLQAD